jgi:hypothetical protein
VSKSAPSSLLWASLIIGVAGLVLLILAVAGIATAGIISGIGIILLAVGIIGVGFITLAPSRIDSSSIDKAASSAADLPPTPAPVAPAPVAPAPVAPAPPAEPVAPPAPPAPVEAAPPAPVEPAPEPQASVTAVSEPAVEDAREFPHPAEAASEFSGPAVTTPVEAVAAPPEPVAPPEPPAPIETPPAPPVPVARAVVSKQPGFSSVRRVGSFQSAGAASFLSSEWVFALASSPGVQHTIRIRARRPGGSAAAWYKGGGIVDILIDNVPTGQFMVIPNKKSAKEDVVDGSTYRVEMQITSDGLTPSRVDTYITVNGVPLEETS